MEFKDTIKAVSQFRKAIVDLERVAENVQAILEEKGYETQGTSFDNSMAGAGPRLKIVLRMDETEMKRIQCDDEELIEILSSQERDGVSVSIRRASIEISITSV